MKMGCYNCRMCGAPLPVTGEPIVECEYCGSRQPVPSADSEKKQTLFARANRLRLACEFDRAAAVYESIAAEFPEEAEASWGIVLCRYGIEYVDDPATGKKVPTCHRSSFASVLEDADYQQTLDNADPLTRKLYHREAAHIEELREGILSVSASEKPYDIFICYKETDERGGRTLDSVLAQDLYDLLTGKGYRVFFSRISLEDKLGREYEPYIFAALNSAKVMLAVGTCFEHYDAVWVKNEWSRFLKLMEQDSEKYLIPCYKDIDAYDMPKEFRKLQAQDLGKVGAHQDLVRGVEKLLPRSKVSGDAESLLKRAFLFLEDGKWSSADEYCEKVLDIDPGCADAYLGKLMAELKVNKRDALRSCAKPFDNNYNYKKAVRFGDSKLREFLEGCTRYITERNEQERIAQQKRAEEERRRAEEERIAREKNAGLVRIAQIRRLTPLREKLQRVQGRISAYRHTVGLKAEGAVVAVGNNFYGQCKTSGWNDVVAVSAGYSHTVGLRADGTVVAVGKQDDGRCDVSEWKDIIAVSAGSFHTVGLRSDGTVAAAGNTYSLACNVSGWTDIVAVSAGDGHTVGLKADGTVVAAGNTYSGACNVSGWTDIVAVSAGDRHTVGLKADGTVVAAGDQDDGRCDVSEWKDIVAVSAGDRHTVGLKADGTMVATRYTGNQDRYYGQCDVEGWRLFQNMDTIEEEKVATLKKLEEDRALTLKRLASQREKLQRVQGLISAYTHTVGLKTDGTVMVVGSYIYGERMASKWEDIVAISAGENFTVGLKADGTVAATGRNYYGQCDVSEWRDVVAISAGLEHTVGLKADGTVVATAYRSPDTNDSNYGQCDVSEWKDIVAVSAGYYHTVGLKADGTVVATKYRSEATDNKNYGQCDVSEWTNIVAISAGAEDTFGLKDDGTVVVVGRQRWDVSGWTDIVAISAGQHDIVGLRADGTVVAVGYNFRGQCDVSEWTDIVAVSVGDAHTVGLKADGTVVATVYTGEQQYYHGECEVDGWRLFQNIDTIAEEKAAAHKKREEEKVLALRKQAEEQERQRRRTAGLCLHCGGTFKGFFTKKCSSCGKEKDY